jgi:hypothetical protein
MSSYIWAQSLQAYWYKKHKLLLKVASNIISVQHCEAMLFIACQASCDIWKPVMLLPFSNLLTRNININYEYNSAHLSDGSFPGWTESRVCGYEWVKVNDY